MGMQGIRNKHTHKKFSLYGKKCQFGMIVKSSIINKKLLPDHYLRVVLHFYGGKTKTYYGTSIRKINLAIRYEYPVQSDIYKKVIDMVHKDEVLAQNSSNNS